MCICTCMPTVHLNQFMCFIYNILTCKHAVHCQPIRDRTWTSNYTMYHTQYSPEIDDICICTMCYVYTLRWISGQNDL